MMFNIKNKDKDKNKIKNTNKNGKRKQEQRSMYFVLLIIVAVAVILFVIVTTTQSQHNLLTVNEKEQQLRMDFLGSRGTTTTTTTTTKNKSVSQTPLYHMVFSTSCDEQQHWESYVFFYYAYKVGQKGTVTRICSGCSDEETKRLIEFHNDHIQPLNPGNFFLHLTPGFGKSQTSKYYKYMNKPFGLLDWMTTTFPTLSHYIDNNGTNATYVNANDNDNDEKNGIVMLLDPDMILLRPLVHDFTNEDVIYALDDYNKHEKNNNKNNKRRREGINKIVSHGYPMAQQDGYLDSTWSKLNLDYVINNNNNTNTNTNTNATPTIPNDELLPNNFSPFRDGVLYWNTGPPYLATVHDMYQIAKLWCEYAPRVYEIHPHLFAEMYGYIIATTQLKLPHTLIKSIVISTTDTKNREGWKYIDDIPDNEICQPSRRNLPSTQTNMPIGLHYCKRYLLGKTDFFSKYRLKKKYISCSCPLLKEPSLDIYKHQQQQQQLQQHDTQNQRRTKTKTMIGYYPPPHGYNFNKEGQWPEKVEFMEPYRAKREAFMLCSLIGKINEAALYWKERNCVDNNNGNDSNTKGNGNGNGNDNNRLNKEYFNIFIDPDH